MMKTTSVTSRHPPPELPRSEWMVMQAVWDAVECEPECTISELLPDIRKKRKWHVSTAKTMADRLVKKGFLTSRIRGKTCFYRPTISREQATHRSVASYLDDVLDGTFGPLVAYLADKKKLSNQEIRQLEKLLEGEE